MGAAVPASCPPTSLHPESPSSTASRCRSSTTSPRPGGIGPRHSSKAPTSDRPSRCARPRASRRRPRDSARRAPRSAPRRCARSSTARSLPPTKPERRHSAYRWAPRRCMVIAVADLDGTILAPHRMEDATFFSVDVALAKSSNVIKFLEDPQKPPRRTAGHRGHQPDHRVSARSRSFPPWGSTFTEPGAVLHSLQARRGESLRGRQRCGVLPGARCQLYKNGVLVGGLGVSGDGVEQDDYVPTAAGALGFEPPKNIAGGPCADRRRRLPYLKFLKESWTQ